MSSLSEEPPGLPKEPKNRRMLPYTEAEEAGRLDGKVPDPREERAEARAQALNDLAGELLKEMRQILDRIRWAPARRDYVDHYAVFLLDLRIQLSARLGQALVKDGRTVSKQVARWFPWRSAEAALAFKPEWPDLAGIWRELAPDLDRKSCRQTGEQLCRRITPLLPPGTDLTVNQWHQWVRRARKEAEKRAGADCWGHFFKSWLREHKERARS